jgi:hypothetical protein
VKASLCGCSQLKPGRICTLAPLDPGDYTVTVAATGFEKLVRKNTHLDGLHVLWNGAGDTAGTASYGLRGPGN